MDDALREVMVPMRDGMELRTVILVPAGAKHAASLLTRTPYDARTNPQTFVPNIFFAKPQDFEKETRRV
jgi:predicted acyl esterase